MIITTSDSIPGKRIVKVLGLTKGNTVRARNIGRDVVAELRNLVGGEIRFTTAQIMEHAAELLAYGTAVVVEDDK
jgi:uncharacterized protein YbjQ (UPF0145 family)